MKHAAVRYVRIKNWQRFQHYKNRNPPWIKLYLDLAEDQAFHALSDTGKVHLIGLWMLAAKLDNQIPDTALWLNRTNMSKRPVKLEPLIAAGFVEVVEEPILASSIASTPASNADSESAKALARGRVRARELDEDPGAVRRGNSTGLLILTPREAA